MYRILRNRKKWDEIRVSEKYQPLRAMLFDAYDKYCRGREIPMLTFCDEMSFLKSGDRQRYEKPYFLRRAQLSIYAVLCAVYPENEEYLDRLSDVICAICDEHSWAVPAHRSAAWFNKPDVIDLFAAETGLYLAEIKQMLIDRLSPHVAERITNELEMRILSSFESEQHWFETLKSNWASVCGGSVGITFMFESPKRFLKIRPRITKCMDNYMAGISDDGGTTEGATYWNYGFSFYVMYQDALRRHTFGRTDEFKKEKVKKTAGFLNSCYLDEENKVSFSDASSEGEYNIWLSHFLYREYGIPLPPGKCGLSVKKFSSVVRAFLYYDSSSPAEAFAKDYSVYYEKLQWYIKRCKAYSFAVKGGNNGEEHNHNDIGSFIVVHGGKQILCDLGAAIYTAQNFGPERYEILNNSSFGHSVPIVNGCGQEHGKEYCGELSVNEQYVNVDMSHAYRNAGKLERNFVLYESSIVMTDSFDSDFNVKERLVTEIIPEISEGKILINGAVLEYPDSWRVTESIHKIPSHDGSALREVHLLDFSPNVQCGDFKLKITF